MIRYKHFENYPLYYACFSDYTVTARRHTTICLLTLSKLQEKTILHNNASTSAAKLTKEFPAKLPTVILLTSYKLIKTICNIFA